MRRSCPRLLRYAAFLCACLLSVAQPSFAEVSFVQTEVIKITPQSASDGDWKTQCAVGLTPLELPLSVVLSDFGQFITRQRSSRREIQTKILERRATRVSEARPGFERNILAAPEQDSTERTKENVDIDTTLVLEGTLQACGVSKQFNIVSGKLRLTGDVSGLPIEVRSAKYEGKEEIALTASVNGFRARLFGAPIRSRWSKIGCEDVIPASIWGQQNIVVMVNEPKIIRGARKGGVLDDINFKLEMLIAD